MITTLTRTRSAQGPARLLVPALAVGLLAAFLPAAPAVANDVGKCGMYAIGHRGDHTNYDENTIGAVAGLSHSETDLRVTKDGQFVLMHDRNVRRTTNGEGYVDELSWDYIRSLRTEPRGDRVPTWRRTLRAIKRSGTVLTVEVKSYSTTWTRKELRKVVRLVRRMGLRDQVFLGGYAGALPVLEEVAADMQLYWRPDFGDRVTAATVSAHSAAAVLILPRDLNKRVVRRAQRADAVVWARRSKKPHELTIRQYWAQIASSGAEGLYTDTPFKFDRWCR
ncbi:MAG: hypothetical protein M3474_00625 [Actinomycetota bacterium]|nr:hypothetical protein [Actinomycetota bacterium]